jgi:hypothetical protein
MAILLKADHRTLLNDAKYTFTNQSYPANTQTFHVANAEGFFNGCYALFGNFGSETAEIIQVTTVIPTSPALATDHQLICSSPSQFGHPESTRVTILPYNKIKFYWTATPPPVVPTPSIPVDNFPTFTGVVPLTTYLDIQCNDWYTITTDETHASGYGWYIFYNATTLYCSTPSNPIPYAGFDYGTVKETMDGFFSLLNQKDAKLISNADAFSWMNEGVSVARTELNLVNTDYNASPMITLNLEAGVLEYRLPDDFSDLLSVSTMEGQAVDFIAFADIPIYAYARPQLSPGRYYVRGKNIGIVPTPQVAGQIQYRYLSKGTKMDSYEDNVDLPDGGFYIIKDYMLYRAYMKLSNPQQANLNMQAFRNGLNLLKLSAVKRSANLDCWSIAYQASI